MEKYAKTCRFILIADSLSQILEPIRSRCFIIRTPKVPEEQLSSIIQLISESENLRFPESVYRAVIEKSDGDIRRTIVCLELLALQSRDNPKSIDTVIPEWERYIESLCLVIVTEKHSSETMKKIRGHLYELIVHCIPPSEIFRYLAKGLMRKIDSSLCPKVSAAAAEYESRMHQGSKPIFHLEAFVARFLCIYQDFIND